MKKTNKFQYVQYAHRCKTLIQIIIIMPFTDYFKDFFCGCVSGWVQVFVMQPFEIVKVRLINQSSTNPQYKGIIDCFKKIRNEEGLIAFYKGSIAPFLGVGAQVALQFGSNGLIKRLLLNFQEQEQQQQSGIPTMGIVFASGLLTGIPSSIVTTPVDHTRIMIQIQKGDDMKNKYHSSIDAGKIIYQKYGLKGLYLGFYPTLLRQNIALSVYFSMYELGMRFLAEGQDTGQAPLLGAFLAGGVSGCTSWIFSYPIDYVKTVIQSQSLSKLKYKSATECAITKYKKYGIKTFFKGFGVTILRSFPVNGAGFLSFQIMMRLTGRKITMQNIQHLQVF